MLRLKILKIKLHLPLKTKSLKFSKWRFTNLKSDEYKSSKSVTELYSESQKDFKKAKELYINRTYSTGRAGFYYFGSILIGFGAGCLFSGRLEEFIDGGDMNGSFFSEWLPEDALDEDNGEKKSNNKNIKSTGSLIKGKVSFKDVCGNEEAKEELSDIVDFMKHPEKYRHLKAKITKGVMLHGPPGCGKTLLARALAGEANVAFLSCESSAFDHMYIGVGPARVRKLFERAREVAPCIIFIDELDLFSRSEAGHESNETTNEMLTQLDGFKTNDHIVVIGSTNLPRMVDKTLLRSGRFDRSVYVSLPEKKARKDILKLYTEGVKLSKEVDFDRLAADCVLKSGADIANIVNTAKISAAKSNRVELNQKDFEKAILDVSSGLERQSLRLGASAKRGLAVSESACALVNLLTKASDRELRRVSIVPRGIELSSSQSVPVSEKAMYSQSREQYLARIDSLIAGQVGQKILLGTEGVTSDSQTRLERATELVRAMLTQMGMGSKLGFASNPEKFSSFLPSQTRSLIDEEAIETLKKSEQRVEKLLKRNSNRLKQISDELLIRESLEKKDIEDILKRVPEDEIDFIEEVEKVNDKVNEKVNEKVNDKVGNCVDEKGMEKEIEKESIKKGIEKTDELDKVIKRVYDKDKIYDELDEMDNLKSKDGDVKTSDDRFDQFDDDYEIDGVGVDR